MVKRATITEKKRRSWNALEKLAIILYQEKVCSVRSAANKFNIEPKQVRDWKKKKEILMKMRPHIKHLGVGQKAKYPELEQFIVSWVKELRQQGKQVTMYMLQLKAKDLAKRKEWIDKYPDFKVD